MLKRTLVLFSLIIICSRAYAADVPPTDASVEKLLEVSQTERILDNVMAQMDNVMKQAMQQATQGQTLSPQIKKDIEKRQTEMLSVFKEVLDWHKLKPVYIRVYQKSFTQSEVDSLIAMYQTPGAQVLLTKMPMVLQNTINEMQPMMQPIMQRIQRMQQDVVAEIQAEKPKKNS